MATRISFDEARTLWREYQCGDMFALVTLMQGYYSDLYQWGMSLHAEKEFIKDCIQDVFLKLWKIQHSVAQVDNVKSYLLVTLKTKILQELSKKQVTHITSLSDEYCFLFEFSEDLRWIDEEHEIVKVKKLNLALNQLPSRQKEFIYLRFYQSLNFEQIAEVMSLSRQSTYNLFQKSLTSLRKYYDVAT
jgi:RNA polymerase sigma factor (sigma-70 family)